MKTEQTLPTDKITANSEQLSVLKNHFPQCFDKNGQFIVTKLQEILQADGIDVSRESYGLNWLGKSYARVLANEPIRTMLSEDTEHNEQKQNKNSHNLLIQGDNLEVLKHLKGAYSEKIKMIYIDPPYNTGSDGFVYQDDRSFTPEQFAELAGVDLEEAKRVLDFTQSNANSHSAWLTFIYPRLYIAKQLLKDDGVIFISIDDNEQAQLKILCDEVFGEANFIDPFIRETIKGGSKSKYFRKNHDYILAYARNKSNLVFKGYEKDEMILDCEDEKGQYRRGRELNKWGAGSRRIDSPSMWYPIYTPEGEEVYPIRNDGSEGRWRFGKKSMANLIKNNNVIFEKRENGTWIAYEKLRGNKTDYTQFVSILKDKYTNAIATEDLKGLFNTERVLFDYAKPKDLIKDLIQLSSVDDYEYVLDFFAGSGSTANAVLELNLNNREIYFINVQLDEEFKKNSEAKLYGYSNIFQFTKDRIAKASEKLVLDNPDSDFEHGFKIFKTCDNFLPSSIYRDLKQLTLEQTNTPVLTIGFDEAQLQDILTTWKGLDKILLSENLNTVSLGDYLTYGFGHVLYLVNEGFNTDALKDLIQKLDDEHEFQVSKLVILGHHFDSKSQREIDEAMKNYNNKKSIPVDVVVRY